MCASEILAPPFPFSCPPVTCSVRSKFEHLSSEESKYFLLKFKYFVYILSTQLTGLILGRVVSPKYWESSKWGTNRNQEIIKEYGWFVFSLKDEALNYLEGKWLVYTAIVNGVHQSECVSSEIILLELCYFHLQWCFLHKKQDDFDFMLTHIFF